MICTECEKIKSRKNVVYEDNLVYAMLAEKPATMGHVVVLPKEHYPIIEKIPDETFGRMLIVANKISSACFEALNAQGTNILIRNGLAAGQKANHSQIHVIPRFENDGLNMQWQTVRMSDDDLSTIQLTLKTDLEKPEKEELKEEKKEKEMKEENKTEIKEFPEEINYLLKQLERIP